MTSRRIIVWILILSGIAALALIASDGWAFDFANTAWGPLGAAVVTAIVTALIKPALDKDMALFQEKVQNRLVQVAEDKKGEILSKLEDKKSDAILKLEERKADGISKLEEKKHELQISIELLKTQHQQLIEKSRTSTAIHFRILPRIYERLRHAEADLCHWYGYSSAPEFSKLKSPEFADYVNSHYRKIRESERQRVIASFDTGIRGSELDKEIAWLQRQRVHYWTHLAARILYPSELFLPRDVFRSAEGALISLRSAADLSKWMGNDDLQHLWDSGAAHFKRAGEHLGSFRTQAMSILGIELPDEKVRSAAPASPGAGDSK